MGLFAGLAKAGLAKKLIDEARKPKNQQMARDMFSRVRSKASRPRSTRQR